MARKRRQSEAVEGDADVPEQKRRKGFQVGPANLPDGTYKRKAQKIKKTLIQKAKLKKSYAKLKEREAVQPSFEEGTDEDNEQASTEIHPERQAMLNELPSRSQEEPTHKSPPRSSHIESKRGQKLVAKGSREADDRAIEAGDKMQSREKAKVARSRKRDENERLRKLMVKAKTPGRNGKRKLGLESHVLLEKVKRLVQPSPQ